MESRQVDQTNWLSHFFSSYPWVGNEHKMEMQKGDSFEFTISNTWNGNPLPHNQHTFLQFHLDSSSESENIVVHVDAPFYNEPFLPPKNDDGPTPQLWDYEVVELFFLGEDEKYLEIELGPKGHYLLLQLHGRREIVKEMIPLKTYITEVKEKTGESLRWSGEAFIPLALFPPFVKSFNAYAIHGCDPNRNYLSLFPVDNETRYDSPDFHRLEFFRPIEIPTLQKANSSFPEKK